MADQALVDVGRALGLLAAGGDTPDPSWFDHPLQSLGGILSQPDQRAALLDLLQQIVPAVVVPGAPAGERWHPLLGDPPQGNLYLTVDPSTPGVTRLGVAGRFTGGGGSAEAAAMVAAAPLFSASGSTVTAIAGTAGAPLTLSLAVPLGWTAPPHPLALAAIELGVSLAPAAVPATATAAVTLRGLDLDGSGPADAVLDPADFGASGARILLALIREQLHEIESAALAAGGPAAAVVAHLLPLLGLDGGSIPPFPFAAVTHDPRAVGTWLAALFTGNPAPAGAWLGHLAGLFGVAAPAATAGPAGTQSWSVPVLALSAASTVNLTLQTATAADGVTPLAQLGLAIRLAPSAATAAATPPVRVEVTATLLSLPLAGAAGPAAFTSAAVTVSAPADPAQPLIAAAPGRTFSLDSLRAGLSWNGSSVAPLLEMRNVALAGAGTFPLIDLQNAATVAGQVAADELASAVKTALGGSPTGQHLAALAGLVAPAGDGAAPLVDVTRLVTRPTAAIAALHRAALTSTAHPWKIYFDEIAALLGIATVAGSGREDDPWAATIAGGAPGAAGSPPALQLVAWNAQASPTADPQQLRLGLRLAAAGGAIGGSLTVELLRADLAASGSTAFALAGALTAAVTITPPLPATAAGFAIGATSLAAIAHLQFGQSPQVGVEISNLGLTFPGGALTVPAVTWPFAAGFDATNPAAALGIGVAALEQLVQALLVRALTAAFGPAGTGLAALLGRLIRRVSQLVNYGGVAPAFPVLAASVALWRDEAHVEAVRERYRQCFAIAERILGRRFGYVPPGGGFFLWLDVGDGEQAAKRLWAEAGIRVLPGGYMARPDADGVNPARSYIRVALVHEPAVVESALTRLVQVLDDAGLRAAQ